MVPKTNIIKLPYKKKTNKEESEAHVIESLDWGYLNIIIIIIVIIIIRVRLAE